MTNIQQKIEILKFTGGGGSEGPRAIIEDLHAVILNDKTIAAEVNQLFITNRDATAVDVINIFIAKWTASLGVDVLAGINVIAEG